MCFKHLTNTCLSYSLCLCCSHFTLSVFYERLLYEAPLMGLWGIYWTSVGDLTHRVYERRCVCTYECVCFLDYHVGSYIMVLFHLCYCVYSHSKAIRFYTKSWSWELWGWERCNWQAGILQSTSLYSWSVPISTAATAALSHTHFDSVTLSVLSSPHMGTSVSRCMHGTDISELPERSAYPLGSTLFVLAVLWVSLMPPTHCLGVVFVPSGANMRQLWPL